MKRRNKVDLIAVTLKQHTFGQQISDSEYRWLAEHVIDALKEAKKGKK